MQAPAAGQLVAAVPTMRHMMKQHDITGRYRTHPSQGGLLPVGPCAKVTPNLEYKFGMPFTQEPMHPITLRYVMLR